jgi:hypothetical protein
MKTATLISDKHQRFESIFKPCKVDLITRHTSTPGVSYGNLSQVLLRDVPRRTPTQGVCAYLLTPGGEPAAFRPDHQFLALSEGVHPVWAYGALNP